jgi:hypothetical protein
MLRITFGHATVHIGFSGIGSVNSIRTEKTMTLIPPVMPPTGRAPSEAELSSFCRTFGLKLERFGGEVSNHYSLLDLSSTSELTGLGRSTL